MNTVSNLILGFDPGLNVTGWGAIKSYGNREEHVDHGTIVTKNQPHYHTQMEQERNSLE